MQPGRLLTPESPAEPYSHHWRDGDYRSDGADHCHSQCEPCGPSYSALADRCAALVIIQPRLRVRAEVRPRAIDQEIFSWENQGRVYRVPASAPLGHLLWSRLSFHSIASAFPATVGDCAH